MLSSFGDEGQHLLKIEGFLGSETGTGVCQEGKVQ